MLKAKTFVPFIFLPIPDRGVSYKGSPVCRGCKGRALIGCTKTSFFPFAEELCSVTYRYSEISVTHGATVVFTETLSCGLLSQLAGSRALYNSFAKQSAI